MSGGVSLEYEFQDAQVRAAFAKFLKLLIDQTPIMADIATMGENATRERFASETGPEGKAWKPSLRAQVSGGKTLTQDGHLGDSISKRFDRRSAEWGTNRIYGAIHQFGGVIKARGAGSLRFQLANGGFATVQSVSMPSRPYLGISRGDEADILAVIEARIGRALNPG